MSKQTMKVQYDCPVCEGEGCYEAAGDIAECDDGTAETELPAKFEVCDTCRGKGSHVNPSIDGNGLTAEDFAEDPDFREDYFSGVYDVTCHECKGLRVVPVIDYDRLNEGQKVIAANYEKRERMRAQWDAEDRHTRRMESGGRDY